jgi:hypothetical protein
MYFTVVALQQVTHLTTLHCFCQCDCGCELNLDCTLFTFVDIGMAYSSFTVLCDDHKGEAEEVVDEHEYEHSFLSFSVYKTLNKCFAPYFYTEVTLQ